MTSFTPKQLDKLLAATQHRPQLDMLEWDGDGEALAPLAASAPMAAEPLPAETLPAAPLPAAPSHVGPRPARSEIESDPSTYGAQRTRIRDRYIAIRFEGILNSSADLRDTVRVIKASRLAFEEGATETTLELLELAIEQNPGDESLWLAELEITYLMRDTARFIEAARAFRVAHPGSTAWPELQRLGRSIAPDETLFGARRGPRDHEHYGPWPHLPNWIQAPWDLTAEVSAADFHRAMSQA
ncbi:MAG: hypothetical protein ABI669_09505 [Usitatibacter sp.]